MKILCLILVLANICVFLWEYRSGALVKKPNQPQATTVSSGETIVLLTQDMQQHTDSESADQTEHPPSQP